MGNHPMLDALSALSLYRQREGLESTLTHVKNDVVSQFIAAHQNQEAFSSILKQVIEGCSDVPAYLQTLGHIRPVEIPTGGDGSAYPRFLGQVQMLRQAVHAPLELLLSAEECDGHALGGLVTPDVPGDPGCLDSDRICWHVTDEFVNERLPPLPAVFCPGALDAVG
jgi:hypothetical protein